MNNDEAILTLDIGTTKVNATVAHNDLSNRINILGFATVKSAGINKGSIVDLDLATESILEAIKLASQSSSATIDEVYVSISSVHTKCIRSNGAININSGQITTKEVSKVLDMVSYNANIIPDHDVIQVLPLKFKIDNTTEVENPLKMHGTRLEVSANIISAHKSVLTNIKSILSRINIENIKFISNGYAAALSLVKDDQKKLGVMIFDLGGSVSELTLFKNDSIIYSDSLPIGSENISNDLSILLHTPYQAANMIKNQYGTLLPLNISNLDNADTQITKVKIPILGNESQTSEIPLAHIQPIIHARVEELLFLIKDKINNSGLENYMDGGIILTGGLTNLQGIEQLTKKIFTNIPIKISNPINIQNGYIDFNTPTMSSSVGLLLYALDQNPPLQLDSSKQLKCKIEQEKDEEDEQTHTLKEIYEEHILEPIPEQKKEGFFNKFFGKFTSKLAEVI
jgi:cell division protein FtsA